MRTAQSQGRWSGSKRPREKAGAGGVLPPPGGAFTDAGAMVTVHGSPTGPGCRARHRAAGYELVWMEVQIDASGPRTHVRAGASGATPAVWGLSDPPAGLGLGQKRLQLSLLGLCFRTPSSWKILHATLARWSNYLMIR